MHRSLRTLAPALLLISAASCGASDRAPSEATGESAVENATLAKFDLTSGAFENAQPIPVEYTCDGSDQSPALSWDEPPAGTKSLAVIMDDPDAPNGTFRHWAAYDIPPSTRSIARGQSTGKPATNDFGKSGYGAPCPPKGHGPHRYRFKLYALDVHSIAVPAGAKVEQVEEAAMQHQLGLAELMGTFERK